MTGPMQTGERSLTLRHPTMTTTEARPTMTSSPFRLLPITVAIAILTTLVSTRSERVIGDGYRTTPEADPCVPCVGDETEAEPDALEVDTSQSLPVPEGEQVSSVSLTVRGVSYPVPLGFEDLQLLNAGKLPSILLDDWAHVTAEDQPTLHFEVVTRTSSYSVPQAIQLVGS